MAEGGDEYFLPENIFDEVGGAASEDDAGTLESLSGVNPRAKEFTPLGPYANSSPSSPTASVVPRLVRRHRFFLIPLIWPSSSSIF